MTDEPSASILRLLDEWIATIPPEAVDVTKELDPEGEYGPSTMLRFRPKRQGACYLEILILDDGSCGFDVDLWSRLAARCGVNYSRLGLPADDFTALFLEPSSLPRNLMLAICKAVAAGEIHLEIGLVWGRIVCTRGFIRTPSGPVRMNGVGGPLVTSKILEIVGKGAVRRIPYDPWLEGDFETAPLS
jgi:hypothetical protein